MNNTGKILKRRINSTSAALVALFVVFVLAISAASSYFFYAAADIIKQNDNVIVINACFGNASAVESYLYINLSELASYEDLFRDAIFMDSDELAGLCGKCVSKGIFRSVSFTRTDGISINPDGKKLNITNRNYIQKGLAGEGSLYLDTVSAFGGEHSDIYTVSVKDEEGRITGALTGETAPYDSNTLKFIDISGRTDCFYIINSSGSIIYAPEGNTLSVKNGDNLLTLVSEESETGVQEIEYILNSINEISAKYIKFGEDEYTAAFAPIEGFDWTFAAIMPTNDIGSAYNDMLRFTIIFVSVLAILLIAALAVIVVMMKRLRNELGEVVDESIKNTYIDSITGHESWGGFGDKYKSAIKNTSAGHAMISMDIDSFKSVNDSFGFEGGNEVLKKLSQIIERELSESDFFARNSGDLFYIMKEFSNSNELIDICENIISDVEYQISDIKLSVSMGIYIISDNNINARVAADRSDLARKTAKEHSESRYAFFDSSMIEKIRFERYIENLMDDALELGEFVVFMQPKFDLTEDKGIVGAEALVRWHHDGTLIPPGEFIPLFEKNGFVMKLDYFMFEETCKYQKKWKNMGFEPKIVSVNMSRLHIHSKGFVEELAAMCEKYGIETKYLEIEITESAAYENLDILCDVFRKIKSYGFLVSIDDFGTGYSSLNMLKDLPVDVLKIDRSFLTEDADEEENASRIIGALVKLATSLGIKTICEGIETKEQAQLLKKLGCNMAQGFYYSRPLPVTEYEKLTYGIEEK